MDPVDPGSAAPGTVTEFPGTVTEERPACPGGLLCSGPQTRDGRWTETAPDVCWTRGQGQS